MSADKLATEPKQRKGRTVKHRSLVFVVALISLLATSGIARVALARSSSLAVQNSAVLAPGVVYTSYLDGYPENVVHVTRISAHAPIRIRPVLADNSAGQTVPAMCQQAHAVACINGDFFGAGAVPLGGELVDGMWVRAPGTTQQQLWLDAVNRFSVGPQPAGARQSLGATSYPILLPGHPIAIPENDAFANRAYARTLVGWDHAGDSFLVTVEAGRGSHGVSLAQAADLLSRLGATTAVNEDGGGSSQMAIDGVLQSTQGPGARRVPNGWAVVR